MVGTIQWNNGYYLYYGKTMMHDELMESVLGKGTFSLKDDLLVMNQVESIDSYYRNIGFLGNEKFKRMSMEQWGNVDIIVEGFTNDGFLSYVKPMKSYLSLKGVKKIVDRFSDMLNKENSSLLSSALKIDKKLQDLSFQIKRNKLSNRTLTYAWKNSVYMSNDIENGYIEWLVSDNKSIISVINTENNCGCSYLFTTLEEVGLDDTGEHFYSKCTDSTLEVAVSFKQEVLSSLDSVSLSLEEIEEYVRS